MSAAKLSKLELGYIEPSREDLSKLDIALRELIAAREKVAAVAETVGWPM